MNTCLPASPRPRKAISPKSRWVASTGRPTARSGPINSLLPARGSTRINQGFPVLRVAQPNDNQDSPTDHRVEPRSQCLLHRVRNPFRTVGTSFGPLPRVEVGGERSSKAHKPKATELFANQRGDVLSNAKFWFLFSFRSANANLKLPVFNVKAMVKHNLYPLVDLVLTTRS